MSARPFVFSNWNALFWRRGTNAGVQKVDSPFPNISCHFENMLHNGVRRFYENDMRKNKELEHVVVSPFSRNVL